MKKLNLETSEITSGTYVVEDTIMLLQDLTLPKDVTLIFQGGRFETISGNEVKITGSNTRLVAPISNIFGKGISVEGSWDIDRAYPQWFKTETETDWAIPINNAIRMKEVGEVILLKGEYEIESSIKVTKGIRLIGENSQRLLNDDEKGGTLILASKTKSCSFSDGYMVHVNTPSTYLCYNEVPEKKCKDENCSCRKYQYINYSTLVKGIRFSDWSKKAKKCIIAGGGIQFDNLQWYNFLQAVKYTDTYNDGKSITNCIFESEYELDSKKDSNDEINLYAFDMGSLGDALRFEHNGISKTTTGKALRVNSCGGASILGNVINGDILIMQSKAVVFTANHCEKGITIDIQDSCVTTQNNFIWKGAKSTYRIQSSGNGDKSVVSLNNDMIIVNNAFVYDDNLTSTLKNILQDLYDYDIEMDKDSILSIENVYRYDVGRYGFGKMYPFGVSVGKLVKSDGANIETNDFEEFNNYSYMASCKSQILSNFKLNVIGTIGDINIPSVHLAMQNAGIYWLGEEGYYQYYYQIIWDKARNIKKTKLVNNMWENLFPINWNNGNTIPCLDVPEENSELPSLKGIDENYKGNKRIDGVLLCVNEDKGGGLFAD